MHAIRPGLLVLVAPMLALIAATERPAHACSCAPAPAYLSPEDGASDVPLNAIVAVRLPGGETAEDLDLRDTATDTPVAVDVQIIDGGSSSIPRMLIATPREPLAPATEYRVSLGDASWSAPVTFTTGDALDEDAPTFPGLTALQADTMRHEGGGCHSSCVEARDGLVHQLELTFPEPGSDVAFFTLALRREGESTHFFVDPIPRQDGAFLRKLGFHSCDLVRAPVLSPGAVYCGRLTAHDAAGNVSGGDVEVCATASACATHLVDESCWPSARCGGGGCAVQAPPPRGERGALLPMLVLLLGLGWHARARLRRAALKTRRARTPAPHHAAGRITTLTHSSGRSRKVW